MARFVTPMMTAAWKMAGNLVLAGNWGLPVTVPPGR